MKFLGGIEVLNNLVLEERHLFNYNIYRFVDETQNFLPDEVKGI